MALPPLLKCKDFRVITLIDVGAGQCVDIHPALPSLSVSLGTGNAPESHWKFGGGWGGSHCGFLQFRCWPPITGPWMLRPRPQRVYSRHFAWHKLALTLSTPLPPDWLSLYCSLGGSSCSKLKWTSCYTPLEDASRITGKRSQVTRGDGGSQSFASTRH